MLASASLRVLTGSERAAAEADALRLEVWGLTFPVDPVQIARKLGIDVRQAALSEKISGALVKKKGEDPIILLNANDYLSRRRFACAHELGHYVSHKDGPEEYEYIDLRDTIWSSAGANPDELFAKAFAANLLLPQDEIRRLDALEYTPSQMACYFGVSADAVRFRLKNPKILQ
jgi:Zn-dependent peptidase ImmA (M78 family)